MKKFSAVSCFLPFGVAFSLFTAASGLMAQSPAPVNLGTDVTCTAPNTPVGCGPGSAAGDYVILSGAAITDVPPSVITGNIGASPITGAAIQVQCTEVTGSIFEVNAAYIAPYYVPPCTNRVANFGGIAGPPQTGLLAATSLVFPPTPAAYNDAATRAPTFPTELYSGNLTGRTLAPGVYKWSTDVSVNPTGLAGGGNALTLSGGPNDVWIFEIAGNLTLGAPAGPGTVILGPGVQANNIFWQVGGAVGAKLFAGSVLYGNVLSATAVVMQAGATLTGRAFAPTGVTMISNAITSPGPLNNGLPFIVGPTVSSTFPTNSAPGVPAINVPINSALTATFSEVMNGATIAPYALGTFTLQQTGPPLVTVTGTVTYAGSTATFTPSSNLSPNTSYTATITTNAKDPDGNALNNPQGTVANYVWTFTTGATPQPAPTVISTVPLPGGILPLGSALSATFSTPMLPATIVNANFSLNLGSPPALGALIPATVAFDGNETATITPTSSLLPNTSYTATITTGVQNLAGVALNNPLGTVANYVWTFTTAAVPITARPVVISTAPTNGAIPVTTTSNLVANFSEPMNPLTISTATFLLKQGTTPVPGTVTYLGTSATFTPTSPLLPNTVYNATITNVAADLSGNTLQGNYLWSFATGALTGQTPVCLANFALLAGYTVANTGTSVITGDIGTSHGGSVIGFPPGTLSGTVHAGDAVAAQGMAAVTAAYADAVSRSVGPVLVAGDIGGQTFTAGLYKSTSSLQISSGNLTLDAKGNVNAVFIFQVASGLSTAPGTQIVLKGGAQAFNVFWQVGIAASLGANSVFNGSILANDTITLATGVTVNGRLAAINGAITLQSDTITSPAPSIAAGAIFNAASWAPTVAAGSIAAVMGNNLASSTLSATAFPLPTTLGGSSFQIGAQSAPLYMTSCGQANLQIPWESAGQTQAAVIATVGGLVSAQQPAALAPFAPGIFATNQLGSGQGAVEIAPTAELAATLGANSRPVNPGEYIAIFCTGLGPVSNQPADGVAPVAGTLSLTTTLPVVTIGGVSAQVTYSGLAPGFAGLYQVNAVVPPSAPAGGSVSLVISIGGVQSNTVTIAVQ